MSTKLKILPAVCCISLLGGCASNQAVNVAMWSISSLIRAGNSGDKPEVMYQMGRYYQGQNRFDLAMAAYLKALAADKNFVEARNGIGVIYSRQGRYHEAIEAFQAAIQQAPKAAHIYNNLGYAYYLQGQYDESVAALEKATALDPANQRALNNLGLAYAKAGNKSESVQAFAQAADAPAVATAAVVEPVQNALPLPAESTSVDAATSAETHAAPPPQPEEQMLALPKDRGVIRPASGAPTIPVVDSHVKLVQLAPRVYELHRQQYAAEPVQVAAVTDASITKVRVEVANGNGVAGMAGKVGKFLRSQGYPAARLTNQKPFQVQMTQIQYRDGHQAEAQRLKSSLPGEPELVQSNVLRADVSVRLVLGKDMAEHLAHFDGKLEKLQLALNAPES